MNPYPSKYPKVRGGFSPLVTGSWNPNSGVSGLGDVTTSEANFLNGGSFPATDPFTGQPVDSEPIIIGIPAYMWTVIAGGMLFFLLAKK
jgi:hypothetical protein